MGSILIFQNQYSTYMYNIEVIEYRSLGKFHSWNFSCEKFMLKYFHLLGYKYVHLLPTYPKIKIFSS